jgi:hypothetical protein
MVRDWTTTKRVWATSQISWEMKNDSHGVILLDTKSEMREVWENPSNLHYVIICKGEFYNPNNLTFIHLYYLLCKNLMMCSQQTTNDTKKVCQFIRTPSTEWCSKRIFPTRVTQGLISNSRGTVEKHFQSLSSNLQNKFFVLCPQLHRVVVKHKALVLEHRNKTNNRK